MAYHQTCDFALIIYEYAESNGQQSATIARFQQRGCQQSTLEKKSIRSYTMFAEAELLDQNRKHVQSAHWEHHVYDVQYDIQDTQTLTDFLPPYP